MAGIIARIMQAMQVRNLGMSMQNLEASRDTNVASLLRTVPSGGIPLLNAGPVQHGHFRKEKLPRSHVPFESFCFWLNFSTA